MSRLAIASTVRPTNLAPKAPTWATERTSTCAAVRPLTAAAERPETSLPNAVICAAVSVPIWLAVTAPSCAAVSAVSWAALRALSVAPPSCAASRLAMAEALSCATRTPRAVICSALSPSTWVALSAAIRSLPAPISELNCGTVNIRKVCAWIPAVCKASKLAIAAGVMLARLTPSAPTCAADKASTCVALRPPTALADRPETSLPSAWICWSENFATWLSVTLASCAAVRAVNWAGVRRLKSMAATVLTDSADTSLPSPCSCSKVNEAVWVAVTLAS